jgi:hypothetical protein
MFDKSLFDKLTFNTREGRPGLIGVHILKVGKRCRYFEIPIEALDSPRLWEAIAEHAEAAWKADLAVIEPCHNCNRDMQLWRRRYEGTAFCGFCGALEEVQSA